MKQIVRKGSHAVVINSNDDAGPFWANLYVNSSTNDLGDITNLRASRQSLGGIQKWAAKVLAQ
jgi:hypothetical protein